jgi:CRP-like cAMP-binding protein
MSKCDQCIVRELSSLKSLTKDELLEISNCKTSRIIKKGEFIFEEGDNLKGVYCVKDGVCKLTKKSPNGNDQTVRLVKKGELLGQRSLISDESTNLSAIAIEEMQVCFIPKTKVLDFITENNKFSVDVMKTAFGDLKETRNLLVNMAQKTVKERLAYTLLYFEDTFGINEDKSLKIQLSREDIASIIGTATESCIRLLSEFKKLQLISLDGKFITINDRNGLKKLASK